MCFVGKKSRHLKITITQDVFKAMFYSHLTYRNKFFGKSQVLTIM